MDKKRILIVDDEAETRKSLSLIMQWCGHDVTAVEDGEKALQTILMQELSNTRFDLLICDIQMPVMTGEELIDKLLADSITIPFLVITGYGEKAVVVRMMRKGCRDFIDKPFTPSEIEERVALILAGNDKAILENKRIETLAKVGLRSRQIVHDMNNILGGTMGFADLALAEIDESNPAYDYLTKIMATTSRAADICKTLLSASRCTEPPALVPTEINSLIGRVAEIIKDIVNKNIIVETPGGNNPIWCNANAERLQQALLNIGINAAQAMPNGGRIIIGCDLTANGDSNRLRITVADTGAGIDKVLMGKIFDSGFTTKKTGNGIGLQTVKEIVTEHQGTIAVESTPGVGSTFIIDLPCENNTLSIVRS